MDPVSILPQDLADQGGFLAALRGLFRHRQSVDLSTAAKPLPGNEELSLTPVIGKYVTCNTGVRDDLIELRDEVLAYAKKTHPPRSFNILLASSPGSGKSFLVKQLAEELGTATAFFHYYVSSFRSREDLVRSLRRVHNAGQKGTLPVVLLDEVDSEVEGKHMYRDLLAPMWDGKFYDGDEQYNLGPAVLFFAASNVLLAPTIKNVLGEFGKETHFNRFSEIWREKARADVRRTKIPKFHDFIDRMDLLLCIPPLDPLIGGGNVASETAQIVSMLVRKYFPDITKIEKSAAWMLIRLISQTTSLRRAESVVFRSRNQTAGEFAYADLPRKTRERHEDAHTKCLHGQYYELQDA